MEDETKELVELVLAVDELLAPVDEERPAAYVEVSAEDWADMVRLSIALRSPEVSR